jgi:hypothetical protein
MYNKKKEHILKKKDIAIVELCARNHYIYVLTLIKLLLLNNNKITLYINSNLADLFKAKNNSININIKENEKSNINFLKEIKKASHDICIITSINRNIFEFIFFKPSGLLYITIHNINLWFGKINKRNLKYIAKYIIRKILLKRASGINVGSYNMKRYLLDNYNYKNKVNVFPFSLYDETITKKVKKNNKIKLVVPGMIDTKRRNYDLLFELINKLLITEDNIIDLLEFELLGYLKKSVATNEVENKIKKFQLLGVNIKYYRSFISDNDYKKALSESDFILGILKNSIMGESNEIYGLSKDTGMNYAMLQAGIPGIFPVGFQTFDEMDEVTYYFKDIDGLIKIIFDFIKNLEEIESIKNQAIKNAIKYTYKIISDL